MLVSIYVFRTKSMVIFVHWMIRGVTPKQMYFLRTIFIINKRWHHSLSLFCMIPLPPRLVTYFCNGAYLFHTFDSTWCIMQSVNIALVMWNRSTRSKHAFPFECSKQSCFFFQVGNSLAKLMIIFKTRFFKRPAGCLKHPAGHLKHPAGRLKHPAGR